MTIQATSTSRIRTAFPGWLDLAGRVSSRTLAEYRYDATNYLTFCTDTGLEPLDADIDAPKLLPNTINRRFTAIKRLAKASAILKRLPAATAQEFSLVENAQMAPLRHHYEKMPVPKSSRQRCGPWSRPRTRGRCWDFATGPYCRRSPVAVRACKRHHVCLQTSPFSAHNHRE